MIDKYFRKPIFWDYLAAAIISTVVFMLLKRTIISLPKEEYVYSIISDLSTVSLTMVGFILTLVTVLVSFKSTAKIEQNANKQTDSVFDIFFASQLYFATIRHLKNGIKSLTLISLTGYALKLTVDHLQYQVLYIFCFIAMTIILLTVGRCLMILSQIIKMQQF